jgi:hypothetical protein
MRIVLVHASKVFLRIVKHVFQELNLDCKAVVLKKICKNNQAEKLNGEKIAMEELHSILQEADIIILDSFHETKNKGKELLEGAGINTENKRIISLYTGNKHCPFTERIPAKELLNKATVARLFVKE